MSGMIPSSEPVEDGMYGRDVRAESAVGVMSGGGATCSGFVPGIRGMARQM